MILEDRRGEDKRTARPRDPAVQPSHATPRRRISVPAKHKSRARRITFDAPSDRNVRPSRPRFELRPGWPAELELAMHGRLSESRHLPTGSSTAPLPTQDIFGHGSRKVPAQCPASSTPWQGCGSRCARNVPSSD